MMKFFQAIKTKSCTLSKKNVITLILISFGQHTCLVRCLGSTVSSGRALLLHRCRLPLALHLFMSLIKTTYMQQY